MTAPAYSDAALRAVLAGTSTIAMVGVSPDWVRPSNFAMKYLQEKGFRVIPVNPAAAGAGIHGMTCCATLRDIAEPFDMVDIFRRPDAVGPIVDDAIALKRARGVRTVWMQIGVVNRDAAARAEEAGLTVIMDRCPKIEFARLHHELSWAGINTGAISSRRPRIAGRA